MNISFNIYGFIIGIAIVIASSLIENQLKNQKILNDNFQKIGIISFIFSIFGARLWHGFTDFHLYKNNLLSFFEIWNGGLSIFGGIFGGILGLILSFYFINDLKKLSKQQKQQKIISLLDYSIFGLPIGQAIGRWGNYFNQELYGRPANGYFKIFIEPEFRVQGFENFEYFHPLFFYEMVATSLFALFLYAAKYKKINFVSNIGSGKIFLIYLIYYSVVRLLLDFLRIDTAFLFFNLIGINQLVLMATIFVSTYLLTRKTKL